MNQIRPRPMASIHDLAAFRRARSEARAPATPPETPRPVIGGGAWYHDAALRDDDRDRHRQP